jgi:hypothetical protein
MPNVQQNDRLHVLRSRGFFFSSRFFAGFSVFPVFLRVGTAFCFFCLRLLWFCVGVCLCLFVIFPIQTGTATSSPDVLTTSPTILNVMFWMKKEAYENTTIKATAKRLKHLQKNCHLADPENNSDFCLMEVNQHCP